MKTINNIEVKRNDINHAENLPSPKFWYIGHLIMWMSMLACRIIVWIAIVFTNLLIRISSMSPCVRCHYMWWCTTSHRAGAHVGVPHDIRAFERVNHQKKNIQNLFHLITFLYFWYLITFYLLWVTIIYKWKLYENFHYRR